MGKCTDKYVTKMAFSPFNFQIMHHLFLSLHSDLGVIVAERQLFVSHQIQLYCSKQICKYVGRLHM